MSPILTLVLASALAGLHACSSEASRSRVSSSDTHQRLASERLARTARRRGAERRGRNDADDSDALADRPPQPSHRTLLAFGDNIVDQRTYVCHRSMAVLNGTLELGDALRGLTLTVSAALYDKPWIDCVDGECTGFHVSLMDALAQKVGSTAI